MKILKEFKEFAAQGSALDLAVGLILGSGFNQIVQSLVNDVIMPPIGLLLSGVDFSHMYLNLSKVDYASLEEARSAGAPVIAYGLFLNQVITFTITAFVVFMLVRQMNRFRRK